MRKNLKRKHRSCPLCKPHKTGIQRRWTNREFDARVRAQREIRSHGDAGEPGLNRPGISGDWFI